MMVPHHATWVERATEAELKIAICELRAERDDPEVQRRLSKDSQRALGEMVARYMEALKRRFPQ